jgi:hypothetical protein
MPTQNRTMPPLCLSPSIQTSRIANSMLRATTLRPPKRNRFCSTGDCSDGDDGEEGQKREREEHEKLMKVGDEGVPRTRGPAFSRLAFIQAYRERQQNPTLAAQPGSSATSIRLGGAQQQQQQQQQQPHQAAAVHASAIPAVASAQQAHAARDSPRHSRAASPAVSVTSGRPHKKPKALDGMMSDSGSGISATVINTAAQQKKAAKLAAGAGAGAVGVDVHAAAAAAPESQQAALERSERDKAALEKKRLQQQQKRAQAQRRKERKKLELEKAQQAGDLQVGTPGSSVAGTPNWQG